MNLTEAALNSLILVGESPHIDFKREWHKGKVLLLHDILCLANTVTHTENDRLLIFGVSDNKEIVGVHEDHNRMSNAELHDLINKITFNIRPEIQVCTIALADIEIDYIIIKDKPEKPYYLLKDYQYKDKRMNPNSIVRAGVIYSRTGDRNTAIVDEGIHDAHLQKMFEERFGINKPIKERFRIYSSDYKNWTYFDSEDNYGYYYNNFPEFTLTKKLSSRRFVERKENWMPFGINAQATITTHQLKYHSTLIMEVEVFDSGDSNYQLCLPDVEFLNMSLDVCDENENIYFFEKNSIKYNISCLLHHRQMREYYDFRKLKIKIKG